ncbi:MAG: C45 family autoproteolytic acyltransferase/hydrolase [Lentisphaeraceae bacterium]|nr:C45 family autoproteolytic acyltransferase/hydrolase [Lentisphaeraceae bacterium]
MRKFSILLFFCLVFYSLNTSAVERVKLAGSSYEMGKAWAEKDKELMARLKIQFNTMASFVLKKNSKELMADSLKISKHMAKEDLDEIRGLADGIGVPFEEMLTFNLFYTLCVTKIGCRQFVTWGDKTEDGELVHTRNLDWNDYPGSPMKKFNTVVNYKGKDQIEYLLLSWPGFCSGLTGTNKEGITIAYNQLPQKGDTSYISEPTFFTIKRALRNATTLKEVIDIFQKTTPMDSGSVMVSDAKAKKAAVIEIIRGEVGVRYPDNDMISNANHPTAEAGIADKKESGNAKWPVCATAEKISGKLSVKSVQNLMAHSNVLQPKLNILSVVFKYSENRMWLSCGKGSAAKGPYIELELFSTYK